MALNLSHPFWHSSLFGVNNYEFIFTLFLFISFSLNSESRSELARKFKYYHRSIRPGDRFNLVETINGTFFALHAEVELLQSSIKSKGKLETELMLSLYYNDERLILRDLYEVITVNANI